MLRISAFWSSSLKRSDFNKTIWNLHLKKKKNGCLIKIWVQISFWEEWSLAMRKKKVKRAWISAGSGDFLESTCIPQRELLSWGEKWFVVWLHFKLHKAFPWRPYELSDFCAKDQFDVSQSNFVVHTATFLFLDFCVDNLKLHSFSHYRLILQTHKSSAIFKLDQKNMWWEAQMYGVV